jgi:hypothetical protein
MNDLRRQLKSFVTSRRKLIRFLYQAADELDKHHKNVKITKVVTGSTGIVGTVVSIAGIIFAVPTGGLSMILTIGGATLAATSGVAHLGSDAAKHFLTQSYIDKLDKLSHADETKFLKLTRDAVESIENLRNTSVDGNISCKTKLDIFNELSSLANLGCSIIRVTRVASTTARSIRVFSAASVVLGKN